MTGFILGFEFINNYFKPLLLIAASCFAIYFAIQKFGNKVIARFEVSLGLFSSDYISNIVLTNKKDKTISIWSIHAVFENDLRLELDKFSPPIVLKSHETVGLSMPKFSSLNVNGDDYTPEYIFGNVSIFLDAGDRLIKCQEDGKKNILSCFTEIKKYRAVFNNQVFNDSVSFILSYHYAGEPYTAFICKSGLIGNEWSFSPNHFGNIELTEAVIHNFLIDNGFDALFSNYLCFKVDYPKTKPVFRKEPKNV